MIFTVRKKTPRVTGAFLIIVILVSACSSIGTGVPEDEKQAFINTYSELVLLQTRYGINDKSLDRYQNTVFNKNGMTREEFISFKEKISANPDLQLEIYQQILEKLRTYREIPQDSLKNYINDLTIKQTEK